MKSCIRRIGEAFRCLLLASLCLCLNPVQGQAAVPPESDGRDQPAAMASAPASWPMRQRDGANTGRADFSVPTSRLNTNFFSAIRWQKPSPGSPGDGAFGGSAMVFFDRAGLGGSDLVVGSYHWPKGVQGMNRHTGALCWNGNPDGGESIGNVTAAFSPAGTTIYVINDSTPSPLMAFAATNGPSVFWHNGADSDPAKLGAFTPKIAPDGRIFAHAWDDRPYAGTDHGTHISLSWSAATAPDACYTCPALWQSPSGLVVVSGGRGGALKAWDGASGAELWSVDVPAETDADATIDPANRNVYLPIGSSSVWIVGLDKNGTALWTNAAIQVFEWVDGVNHPQRAQSAGCLAADGLTYYFQTVSEQGDGRLYAIRTANGSVKWTVNTASRGWEAASSSPIVTPNGVVIAGNNDGGAYFAILDAVTNGVVLATLPVTDGGSARASATLAPDGLLYLPARLDWTRGNGDYDAPTYEPANVFTAFDLNANPDLPPVSGTLYIDLRATNAGTGSATWTNQGTLGHFTRHGSPSYTNNVAGTGIPGMYFNGDSAFYEGPASVADLEGHSDRSVEVWVFNPDLPEEESLVAWSHRGGPDGSAFVINYGNSLDWGAVGHWGWDMGWGATERIPVSNAWHHFVYTYNGGQICKFYVDGQLAIRAEMPAPLLTHSGNTILVGAQHENETDFSFFFSGYINAVRVYGGVLNSNEVAAQYALGPVRLAGPSTNFMLTIVSARGVPTPAVGQHEYTNGQTIVCSMPATTIVDGGTEYACSGWTGNGSVGSGSGHSATITLTTNSTLTWVWAPSRYYLTLATNGNGHLDRASQWLSSGVSNTIAAVADAGWQFDHWSGDTNGCVINHGQIETIMDQPRQVTAHFVARPNLWRQVSLPETSGRDRHVALGSDGTNVYYTRAQQANAPFYRIAKGSVASADWQSMAPLPIPSLINTVSGVGDLAYLDGALWTLGLSSANSQSPRVVYRYSLASNSWSKPGGVASGATPHGACAPLGTNRILGGRYDSPIVYVKTDWPANTAYTELGTLPGGSCATMDACMHGDCAYYLKHREGTATNGVLVRIDYATGSAVFTEIPGLPFNTGMGCAIEFVPGTWFPDGHHRLWIIRGGASNNGTDLYWRYGESWTLPCAEINLAIYDLVTGIWSVGSLPFSVDDGSEMCLAGDTLYVLAANGVTDPLRFLPLNDTNAPPYRALTVVSAHGAPTPAGGQSFLVDQSVLCTVPEIVRENGVEHRCIGWQGTGNVASGGGTNTTVVLTEDSSLTWIWMTNRYLLTVSPRGSGHADILSAWFAVDALKTVTAYAAPGWQFADWTGDTNGCSIYQNTITVVMNQPRQLIPRFVRSQPVADATRFVSATGSHTPPFNSWLTAATNLQAAVDAASAGETILVTNGAYSLSAEISLNKGVALKSVNGPGLTVLDGTGQTRCLRLGHANAVVDGFTITGGWTTNSGGGVLMALGGTLRHCLVVSNCSVLGNGGGILSATQGCRVEYCQILNNSATNGAGGGLAEEYASTSGQSAVENCVIAGNEAKSGGGIRCGVNMRLRNLLVTGNRATDKGGGVITYDANVVNCVIVENSAGQGGGIWIDYTSGTVANCIVERNHVQTSYPNFYDYDTLFGSGTRFNHSYTVPFVGGFETSPEYADAEHGDYRLRPRSAGLDQGVNQSWMTTATDLDGRARIVNGVVDLGATEFADDVFFCDLAQVSATGFIQEPLLLRAVVFGPNTNGLFYHWDLDGDGIYELAGPQFQTVTNIYSAPGTYPVSLFVSNAVGQVACIHRAGAVETGVRQIYVSPDGVEWPPYTNWFIAARSIQAALDIARDGSVIWVTNGLHSLTNELRVLHGITLQSMTGAENTFIIGNGSNRCLWISHSNALVKGFTITNGYVKGGDGGGVHLQNGTLSSCTVVSNRAVLYSAPPADDVGGAGGGIYMEDGRIEDCQVSMNTGLSGGIEMLRGQVDRCVIRRNYGYRVGGAALYGGALRNSVIAENTGDETYFMETYAAGVALAGNGEAIMESCTVVSNCMKKVLWGHGLAAVANYDGIVRNSIVASNACTAQISGTTLFVCSSDPVTGLGCFQADPRFVNLGGGDYRLRGDSPCVNTGTNLAWMTGAVDLAGKPRLLADRVDVGAYEYDPGIIALYWTAPASDYLHDTLTLSWETVSGDQQPRNVTITASRLGGTSTLGSSLPPTGAIAWDTTVFQDGNYELRATLFGANGQILTENTRWVLVNNSVIWHEGLVAADETWTSEKVHVVVGPLTIQAGRTLTLGPGAIIKCIPGTLISLQTGARLRDQATPTQPAIMTVLTDDSAGGDVNGDGTQTQPQPGDWQGFHTEGTATVNLSNNVETRYLVFHHSGGLAANEVWLGSALHWIDGHITVESGKTLVIQAGAVVRFAANFNLIVATGGTLLSQGTVTRPVIVTSAYDSIAGSSTNTAQPGDWGTILVDGRAELTHTAVRYGGQGIAGDLPCIIKARAAATVLILRNCIISDSLYDGIYTFDGMTKLENCLVLNNDRGIFVRGNSVITLINCTIHGNRWGVFPHGGTVHAWNNLITDNLELGVADDPSTFHHNNVWNPGATDFARTNWTGIQGNISADPKYRNSAAGNFQLSYLSPAIDAADTPNAPLTDFSDAPRYDDPRSPNTGIAGTNGTMADIGAYEFVENAISDIDLVARQVTGPSQATAGDTVTISWQVKNQGVGTSTGSWHDQIYLVPDVSDGWSQAILCAEVGSSGVLGPEMLVTLSQQVVVPFGTEGSWRWQVKANCRGEIFEGQNWNNNRSELSTPMILQMPALAVGAAVQYSLTSVDGSAGYKILQPAGQDLGVSLALTPVVGTVELLAGVNRMPDRDHFDVRSAPPNTASAQLTIPSASAERTVYLLVRTSGSSPAQQYQVDVQTLDFGLTKILLSVAGNGGTATIPVLGSGFTADTVASLRAVGSGSVIAAAPWILEDSTRGYARFDLRGASAGYYTVVLQRGGTEQTLPSAFLVRSVLGDPAVGEGQFFARLRLPNNVRQGRPFTGYVTYGNSGRGDLSAPLLILDSDGSAEFLVPGTTNDYAPRLRFLAVAQNRILPSTLLPSDEFTYEFRGRVIGGDKMTVSLLLVGDDSTHPIDYGALKTEVSPDHPHVLFDPAWDYAFPDAGDTRGDYVRHLGEAADRAANYGQILQTEQSLLTYLVRESVEQVQTATVSGTVYLDNTTRPLSRVPVVLTPENTQDTNVYATTSWYDGTFGVRNVPPGKYEVYVDGYYPSVITNVTVPPGNQNLENLVVIAKEAGGVILGKVSDQSTGKPITVGTLTASGDLGFGFGSAVLDDQGGFLISNLEQNSYELQLAVPGYPAVSPMFVEVKVGRTNVFSFSIARIGGTIQGVVKDDQGLPVAGASVAALGAKPSQSAPTGLGSQTQTDGGGAFALTGLAPGSYILSATHPGRGVSDQQPVTIVDNLSLLSRNLILRQDVSLRVLVRNAATGSPVKHAIVTAEVYPAWGQSPCTDDQGTCVLSNLTKGSWAINVSAAGYARSHANVALPTAGLHSLTIDLGPLGAVAVQTTRAGNPLAGARVTLFCRTNDFYSTISTDKYGRHEFRDIPPGPYGIAVGTVYGLSWGREDFEILPSAPNLSFHFDVPLSLISGHVWTANRSAGLSQVTVCLFQQGELISQTTTDAMGKFVFLVYQPGLFDVAATRTNELYTPWKGIQVTAQGMVTNVDLVAPTNQVVVRVSDGLSGQGLARALVSLRWFAYRQADITFPVIRTDAIGQGTFLANTLEPCLLEVLALAYNREQKLLASANSSLPIEVPLAKGNSLGGRVTFQQAIAPYVRVGLCAADGTLMHTTLADTNGLYEFRSVSNGVFSLLVRAQSGKAGWIRTNIVLDGGAQQAENIELALNLSNTVTGRVLDGSGHPVIGALLTLQQGVAGLIASASTDHQGQFALRQWPEGSFLLQASAPGYRAASLPVSLAYKAPPNDLVLRMSSPLGAEDVVDDPHEVALTFQTPKPMGLRPAGDSDTWSSWLDATSDSFQMMGFQELGFWKDVLSGSFGLVDPQVAWDNFNIDWLRDFEAPLQKAIAEKRDKCYWDSYYQGRDAYGTLKKTFDNWSSSYQAAKQVGFAEVGEAISRALMIAVKTYKCLLCLGNLNANAIKGVPNELTEFCAGLIDTDLGWITGFAQGSMKDPFSKKDQLGTYNQMVDSGVTVYSFAGDVGKMVLDAEEAGLPDKLAGVEDSIVQALSKDPEQIETLWKQGQGLATKMEKMPGWKKALDYAKGAGKAVGVAGDILEILMDLQALSELATNMDEDVLRVAQGYLSSQDSFLTALKKYNRARKQMLSLGEDCKTSDATETEPSEDPWLECRRIDIQESEEPKGKDPNDKSTSGVGASGLIAANERVYYTIRFENKPEATGAAQTVVITDPLDPALDEAAMELGELGFNNVVVPVPAGRIRFETTTNVTTDLNPVHVLAVFNTTNRTLHWTIESVDRVTGGWPEDPLSGFLPPNTNNHCGEGYVTFSVRAKTNVLTGTVLTNLSSIVFDVNAAILTPTVTNRMDRLPPSTAMAPLPGISPSTFTVSWSGFDTGPAGLANYDVYVARENGLFVPLLMGTTNTTYEFNGEPGVKYGFKCRARDRVGNAEPLSAGGSTETTVEFQLLTIQYLALPLPQVVLSWQSATGLTYQIQHSPKVDTNFTNFVGPVFATPPINRITNPANNHPDGFYRIMKNP